MDAQSKDVALVPGARPIPDYELVERLGKGGFGEVWKAHGPGGFAIALKFIRLGESVADTELRSLEVMKNIRHPNLLGMFGAWQRHNLLIIAMELADGTLLDRLQQAVRQGEAGIPAGELLGHLRDAARGIDYLNDIQVQHRDIKPPNLLLVGGGVRVGDFGLAKLMENTIGSASGSLTPAYAAPEFFRGQVTRWSDQYSLAATWCHLRVNRLPFQGSPQHIMAGHLMEAPDLSAIPAPEHAPLLRALAKTPEERWPNCREFVEAMASALAPPPPASARISSAPQPGPESRAVNAPVPKRWQVAPAASNSKRRVVGLAALACVAICAVAAIVGYSHVLQTPARPTASVAEEVAPAPSEPTAFFRFEGDAGSIVELEIRARLQGRIAKVCVSEGCEVQADQVLFELDDRPFAAAVTQATAARQAAEANAQEAANTADRARQLAAAKLLSKEEMEEAEAGSKIADAKLAQARSEVQNAEHDRSLTKIVAPMAGRIGTIRVTEGEQVLGSSLLTEIERPGGCAVGFHPSLELLGRMMTALRRRPQGFLECEAGPDEQTMLFKGQIRPQDLRGTAWVVFPNEERIKPGTHLHIRVPLE